MNILSGRRPVWLLLSSLLILGAAFVGRLTFNRVALSAGETNPRTPAQWRTVDTIASLQDRLRLNPEDSRAYTELGLAFLQRVRETGDATLYHQAEQALSEALRREPQQFEALIGQGLLALARHDFSQALHWGEQARQLNAYSVRAYGLIFDAQIELGRYAAAEKTMQTMLATRPELSVYTRLAYLRELNGDIEGAIAAMRQAVDSGLPKAEGTLWAQVQLGQLYFNQGDLAQAEQTYLRALFFDPDYVYAFAGMAQVRAAQGDYAEAIEYYETLVELLPLPQFVIALGDLYQVTGQEAQAQAQYELVSLIEQLNAEAGMDVDLELALFKADHGLEPGQTVRQAQAAYQKRPNIHGADVLAWALYQDGQFEEALVYSQEALRLNSRDALLHFHAGMIRQALGHSAEAREHLGQALAINPYFSIRYAPQAEALLVTAQ